MRQIRIPIESFEGPCQRIDWPEAREGRPDSILVIRRQERWHAVQNHCPHWRMPLAERGPDAFDEQSGYVVCTSHAAIFQLRDGLCVSGPCVDDRLDVLDVQVDGDMIVVTEARRSLSLSFVGLSASEE